MTGTFTATPFDSLAEDLESTLSWIEDLGIAVLPTRLARYRKLVKEVIEVAARRDLERANSGFREFANALFEAHELVLCHQGLAHLPASLYADRLREVAAGPVCYDEEQVATAGNRARNTAFELMVTARLASAGLAIKEELPTDVAFLTDAGTILIECKRPQSQRTLEKSIRDAKRQLVRKFQDPRRIGCRGMIALELTKLANPRFGYIVAPTAMHARIFVEQYLSDFIDQRSRLLNLAHNTHILAFLLRLGLITECQDSNTLMYCQQYGLAPLPDLSARDRQTYRSIEGALGAVQPFAHSSARGP